MIVTQDTPGQIVLTIPEIIYATLKSLTLTPSPDIAEHA